LVEFAAPQNNDTKPFLASDNSHTTSLIGSSDNVVLDDDLKENEQST
jgi:hypothetical protein